MSGHVINFYCVKSYAVSFAISFELSRGVFMTVRLLHTLLSHGTVACLVWKLSFLIKTAITASFMVALRHVSYRMFNKYCVFLEDFKIFRTLAFLCFLSVSVRVQTQVGRTPAQRCSRTGRVQKNHKISRKKHNI